MSRVATELGAGRLPNSAGDLLIVLVEQDDRPVIQIHWPGGRPTTIDPARFPAAAETVTRVFAEAVEQLEARRHR
jgi:hypothetical protein